MKQKFITAALLLIFIIGSNQLLSQLDKNSVYKKFIEKFKSIKTISVKFSMSANTSEIMTIKAERGNKYMLDLGDRKIYCNAKKVWNYSIKENSVVISSFEPSDAGLSVEQVFFDIIESFTPSELKQESSTNANTDYTLTLINPEKHLSASSIKSLKIYFNKKNLEIHGIRISTNDGSEMFWIIHELTINPKYSGNYFEFAPPKDCKVIELR